MAFPRRMNGSAGIETRDLSEIAAEPLRQRMTSLAPLSAASQQRYAFQPSAVALADAHRDTPDGPGFQALAEEATAEYDKSSHRAGVIIEMSDDTAAYLQTAHTRRSLTPTRCNAAPETSHWGQCQGSPAHCRHVETCPHGRTVRRPRRLG